MNEIERSYVAAFFEAEGCTNIRKPAREGHRRYAQLRIGQKDPEILRWIQETTGMGHLYPPSKQGVIYSLVIYRLDDIRKFTRLIYPFMRSTARKKKLKEAYELSRR